MTSRKLDFREIRDSIPIEHAISLLGLKAKQERNGQYRSMCPRCDSTDDRALAVTPRMNSFTCFLSPPHEYQKSGKWLTGDIIGLVAHVRNCSYREAAMFLLDSTTVTASTPQALAEPQPAAASKAPAKSTPFDPDRYRAKLVRDHELLRNAGITPEMAVAYDMGYDPKGTHQGKIAIPIYENGVFKGWAGISEIQIPKKWRAS